MDIKKTIFVPGPEPLEIYDCILEPGVILKAGCSIGSDVYLRAGTIVEPGAIIKNGVETGYNVIFRTDCIVGEGSSIWSQTIIDPKAVVGQRAKIHALCYISQLCFVGDDVFMAPQVGLANDKHPPRYDECEWEPVAIEAEASIGMGVHIGPGVTVGEGARIGIGAVVIRDVPSRQIWAGVPAVRIR